MWISCTRMQDHIKHHKWFQRSHWRCAYGSQTLLCLIVLSPVYHRSVSKSVCSGTNRSTFYQWITRYITIYNMNRNNYNLFAWLVNTARNKTMPCSWLTCGSVKCSVPYESSWTSFLLLHPWLHCTWQCLVAASWSERSDLQHVMWEGRVWMG